MASGAEVCVRYGGETAGDLLVDYGFADSRAPPLASLEFEIDEEDPNYDDKCDAGPNLKPNPKPQTPTLTPTSNPNPTPNPNANPNPNTNPNTNTR